MKRILILTISFLAILISCNMSNKGESISESKYATCDSTCIKKFISVLNNNDSEEIRNMLAHEIDPNLEFQIDELKWTPFILLISSKKFQILNKKILDETNLDYRFDILLEKCYYCFDSINVFHHLAFDLAINESSESINVLKKLIDHQDLINSQELIGMTPLDIYCTYGRNAEIVDSLVRWGAKIESNTRSALHYASEFSNYNLVEKLLKLGANPTFKNINGESAYDLCQKCSIDGFAHSTKKEDKIKTLKILEKYNE